jgi:hypothetical protein
MNKVCCLAQARGQPLHDKLALRFKLERVKGIEPSYEAWEAAVLPLNYTRDESEF